jgi:L-aspartate oxidase
LASGGLAGIYQHSTNPSGFNALGSSVALSERSGVLTKELEFVQFHPTSLYVPNEARFLLTEALRGEGAILRNKHGEAFMKNHHELRELAPRDVVARGVFAESQSTGQVYLDITHRDAEWLYARFPTIQAHVRERGLDLANDWLPVIPAAHYTCGGIATDLSGKTSLENLYAAGEAARTGLHGGNRLASTSLLEGLVFGTAVAEHVGMNRNDTARGIIEATVAGTNTVNITTSSTVTQNERNSVNAQATELLRLVRKCMWDHVGVIRTVSGLQTALDELDDLRQEAFSLFNALPTRETAGVRDAAVAGRAVAQAALQNRNSIGAHCIVVDDEDSEEEDNVAAAVGGMQ